MTGGADSWLLLVASGFVIGVLVGLTGVGAGSVTTPLLITGFGVPAVVAVGTDLVFASITKAGAAWRHHRLGTVEWPVFRALAYGSLPAAAVVLVVIGVARPSTAALAAAIRFGLAFVLLVSAVTIVFGPVIDSHADPDSDAKADDEAGSRSSQTAPPLTRQRSQATVALGALLGALVALTSIGAGAIGVVVLAALYPQLAARRLVGTDIAHAVPLTLLCGLGHLSFGHIDGRVLVALLIGSLPGIAIGTRATGLVPDRILRLILAAVLTLAAIALFRS